MVLEALFREVGGFFVRMCNIELQFGSYTFSVGSVYLWCGVAVLLIYILKGLSS